MRPPRPAGPAIDQGVTGDELDREVLNELVDLPPLTKTTVARHLVMAGRLLDDDPDRAFEHASAALQAAPRLAAVREAAGLSAYASGRYAEALAELRAARRISGSDDHLPVIADSERGLGRPERALNIAGSPEASALDAAGKLEMRIVAAGARQDLGQPEAAVLTLHVPELHAPRVGEDIARLRYAYAEALLAAGRQDEAMSWFARASDADPEGLTGAGERLAELSGVTFVDLEEDEAEGGGAAVDEHVGAPDLAESEPAGSEPVEDELVEAGRAEDRTTADDSGEALPLSGHAGRSEERSSRPPLPAPLFREAELPENDARPEAGAGIDAPELPLALDRHQNLASG